MICLYARTNEATIEVWRTKDGSEVAVVAATWELNKKVTFESLASEFQANPIKAWRNYGSVVSLSLESAIKDTGAVLRNVNTVRNGHPWDETRQMFFHWFRGKPSTRYFLHFDLSKSRDATGIALVHREKSGVICIDFCHRVEVPPGRDINYAKLREQFVYPLTERGFHLEMITHDQFQSAETQQVLQEKGYQTDRASADKDTEAYDTCIEMLLTGRLDYYSHPTFIREMEELKLVNGIKYDHPRKTRAGGIGSKDVADAVACAAYMAIQYELDNPVTPPGKLKVVGGGRAWNPAFGERTAW